MSNNKPKERKIEVLWSLQAKEEYEYYKAEANKAILIRAVNDRIEKLADNPEFGNQIPKNLIPREYIVNYGVDNLWRVGLPEAHRMVYTLTANNQIEFLHLEVAIIDLLNHKDYCKKFGYKG